MRFSCKNTVFLPLSELQFPLANSFLFIRSLQMAFRGRGRGRGGYGRGGGGGFGIAKQEPFVLFPVSDFSHF